MQALGPDFAVDALFTPIVSHHESEGFYFTELKLEGVTHGIFKG
jgi:hypothetical protein